jgi:hypothetical protein
MVIFLLFCTAASGQGSAANKKPCKLFIYKAFKVAVGGGFEPPRGR